MTYFSMPDIWIYIEECIKIVANRDDLTEFFIYTRFVIYQNQINKNIKRNLSQISYHYQHEYKTDDFLCMHFLHSSQHLVRSLFYFDALIFLNAIYYVVHKNIISKLISLAAENFYQGESEIYEQILGKKKIFNIFIEV